MLLEEEDSLVSLVASLALEELGELVVLEHSLEVQHLPLHREVLAVAEEASRRAILTTSLGKFYSYFRLLLLLSHVIPILTCTCREFFKNMGGSGGASFGGFDDDNMHGMPGGMPGGIFGNLGNMRGMGADMGGGARTKRRTGSRAEPTSPQDGAPAEVIQPLRLKLEDIATGTTKKMKVTRRLLSGEQVEKTLEIHVSPGQKAGTKFRFKGEGNEQLSGESQDLVFVIEELPHERFTRDGNDLVTTEKITLVEALTGTGGTRQIRVPDGRRPSVTIPASVVKPGSQTRVPGFGMPIRKAGETKQTGDLIVKWDIEFPDRLTSSQKEGLKKILA
jgi:DnaJ homolog subfamily B member 4